MTYQYTLPKTIKQALANEVQFQSMKNEYDAHNKNNIWVLAPYPKHRKVINNKWLLKIKELVDGSLEKLKSRLITKGYLQVVGYDFPETYQW